MNSPSAHRTAQVIPLYPHDDPASDAALRSALRHVLQAPAEPALQQLEQRVLADWRRLQPPVRTAYTRAASAQRGSGRARLLGGMPWQHRPWAEALPAWMGAACLVLVLGTAYTLWLRQTGDPALEELAQVDVLSQMAAGEM